MDGIDTYKLSDGCSCSIAPGWGCNLISWTVSGVELMYCPPDYPAAARKITGGGNPLLFPAVGRTWDHSTGEPVQGAYRIHGKDGAYFMPSHGIIYQSQFAKVDESIAPDRATVLYKLTVPEKVREENYPFDLGFAQRFTLTAGKVELETTIANKGTAPAPAAFGHHPYFRVSNPAREGVEVRLPVRKHLLLTSDTVLLTGESEDTDGILKLKAGVYYDNAFGDPTGRRMSLIDRKADHTISVDYDEKFELFFVYAPDDAEFMCIEPWTRGLGGFEHLREPGWENGEFIPVLQPGEVVTYRAAFSVEESVSSDR